MKQDDVRKLRLFLGIRVQHRETGDKGTLTSLRGYEVHNRYLENEECVFMIDWDNGKHSNNTRFTELDILDEEPRQVYKVKGIELYIANPFNNQLLKFAMEKHNFQLIKCNPQSDLEFAKLEFQRTKEQIEKGDTARIDEYNAGIEYNILSRNYVDVIAENITSVHLA